MPKGLKAGRSRAEKTTVRAVQRRSISWNPDSRELVVGQRRAVLACGPGDNECVLRTYLSLVAEQRDVVLGRGMPLRADDVAVLAELLDLDDSALEARLQRILRLSSEEASSLRSKLLRHRLAAGAVGVGLAAAASFGVAQAVAAQTAPDSTVDIGYTVRYERDPDFVAPEGVDIGDAMVLERDAP